MPGKEPPGFGFTKSSFWASPVGTKKDKVLEEKHTLLPDVGAAITILLSLDTPKFSESQPLSACMYTHESPHAAPSTQPTSSQLTTGEVKSKLTALHGSGTGR